MWQLTSWYSKKLKITMRTFFFNWKGNLLRWALSNEKIPLPNLWETLQKIANSSITRQKGQSQNGCFKKTKHAKTNIFYPDMQTYVAYQGIKNVRFSENLTRFVFFKHPFWDSIFCLTTDKLTKFYLKKKYGCQESKPNKLTSYPNEKTNCKSEKTKTIHRF